MEIQVQWQAQVQDPIMPPAPCVRTWHAFPRYEG